MSASYELRVVPRCQLVSRVRSSRERVANAIEDHRLHWNITDPHPTLGPEPADLLEHKQRQRVLAVLAQFQHEQQRGRAAVRNRSLGISRTR